MPIVTRHSAITVAVLAVASLSIVGVFVWSGIYNIGADDTHTKPVYAVLQMMRERSITARADKLHPPPNLDDPALIRQGAGNYNAMCTGCHLGPGMEATELSKGLYPPPPNLSQADVFDPSHHFWVIKHGIKASGMPAWGKSMSDEYLWNMVAFLKVLPRLNAEQYQAMVARSGGHEHGGGETMPDDHGNMPMEGMPMDESKPHAHPPGTPTHQDKAADPHAGMDMGGNRSADASKPHVDAPDAPADHHKPPAPTPAAGTVEHRHADGTVESHPAPQPTPADDGHEH
ncbi:MAG: c-type cytochrome [Lysobacter sp.]